MRVTTTAAVILTALLALVAGSVADPTTAGAQAGSRTGTESRSDYSATIRRTAHGIPHIEGGDFGDLGFGYGYALAKDNVCVMAEEYVTVNGNRSKYFGPNGTYTVEGNGFEFTNFSSDVYYRAMIQSGRIDELLAKPPPVGPVHEVTQGVRGYVAGYNHYLQEIGGAEGIEGPACAAASWVRPITVEDAYRRFYSLGILASSGIALDAIAGAEPPRPDASSGGGLTPGRARQLGRRLDNLAIGSNAYGLGSETTAEDQGMVLGNPHFPWHGSERFYQAHLTIPGEVNVQGASLFGVPLVLIGHTNTMAWSHTVSTARRFTIFELQVVPGSPTTYLVDGQPKEMRRIRVTVPVKVGDQPGGDRRTGDLYMTEYGPVLNGVAGLPIFPWTDATAYAMGDVNSHNFRYLNHFFFTNQADSVRELHDIEKRYQGIPWVNTIAADASGEAYYADIGAIPHVTDAKLRRCSTAAGQALFEAARVAVLDGRRSSCQWGSDDDAVVDGTFGPSNEPHMFRDDYVTNSNDSYWLSNPEVPLEGFARIIGSERTQRSLRTRLGLLQVIQRVAGEDGRPGEGFTLSRLQDVAFGNRQYAGELTRQAAVDMCRSMPAGQAPSSSGPTSVDGACRALEQWDEHVNLNSNGGLLFRRFWSHADDATPDPWVNDFDPERPVRTPNTLDTNNPQVHQALGDAINDLRGADIPLDAPLRGYQSEARGDEKIPIHGGPGTLGVFNAINVEFNGTDAYRDVAHGSSFVMAVSLAGDCADPRTIMTYSQSTDPTSGYWADQTRLFSDKQWVDVPFCAGEVAAAPKLSTTRVSSGSGAAAVGGDGGDPAGGGPGGAPGVDPADDAGALPATGGGLGLVGLAALAVAAGWRRRVSPRGVDRR